MAKILIIEESVKRILTLKVKRGIIKEQNPQSVDENIANAEKIVVVAGSFSYSFKNAILAKHDNMVMIRSYSPLDASQVAELENAKTVIVGSYT
nr:hypothetical protein [Paraliobacillus quinghaiensis]